MTAQVYQYERLTRSVLQAKLVETLEIEDMIDYDGDFILMEEDDDTQVCA